MILAITTMISANSQYDLRDKSYDIRDKSNDLSNNYYDLRK